MESVLIVDDETDNLEALRRLLRRDFEVTTTSSGVEALKLLRTQEFAVIVSDQRMPEITGVDLLEKAKTLCPETSRILLTGYTEVESIVGAINRGNIYRYVAKPWDPDDLRITLQQAAEAYRLKKDLEVKNRDLQSALDQLTVLDRAKGRFLSLVSHELNTPLTAVTAFVALLGESKGLPADVQRAVVSLAGASDRLGEIIEDVLSYVRLEATTQWRDSDFDWENETVSLIKALESHRARKQVDVAVQGKAGVLSKCDPEKTRLAIACLLKEAIARSLKGERVTVLFKKDSEALVFRVSWKGEAISNADMEAFETSSEILHHHRNLALGLAIAKRTAEGHGGNVSLESGADKTASIQMRLPLAPTFE